MDYKQLQAYQQQLLDQALSEGLRRNNEQIKIWSEYKKRHEKVIEGLKILPQNLSVNCMVPIGKKALMKGKITHTNEIMVCLGDGYFVKYSAPQAIDLCNRRIKKADEMLDGYEKEKDLLEMRKMVPEGFDSFGNDEIKEVVEHWDDKKLEEWRDEHREKEKKYRKKLKELKNLKKPEAQSEDDLFSRLDALELQEELEDELARLESEYPDYYEQLDVDEYLDESEVDSDDDSYQSDYSEDAINEVPDKKTTKQNHRLHILNSVNSFDDESIHGINGISKSQNSTKTNNSSKVREKKVVFAEPQVKYFSNEEEMNTGNEKRRISVIEQRIYECSKEDDDSDDDSEPGDTNITNFKHPETEISIPIVDNNQLSTPRDIQLVVNPKSILKRRSDDINLIQQSSTSTNIITANEESNEEKEEKVSAYVTVVKDIIGHAQPKIPVQDEVQVQQKRPVSKFKMERAAAFKK